MPRGAAPVGMLAELPALEQSAILALRQWCAGPEARAQVAEKFHQVLAPPRADQELQHCAQLFDMVVTCSARPLMRHGADCACFGGDENAFAQLVAAAALGNRDEALIFALALITPPAAFAVVRAAEPVGMALLTVGRLLRFSPTHNITHH